jgi:undecaprenyl diphosphate synthase
MNHSPEAARISEALKSQIDFSKLPQHIAIIMDGNGRWAKGQGKNRIYGHTHGVKSVREVTEGCVEIGVKYLTLYAFSTENWNRPNMEVTALMDLLFKTTRQELKTLMDNDIRLRVIGSLENLPSKTASEVKNAIEQSAGNKRMDLIIALSYSGRSELLSAVKSIADKARQGIINPDEIDEETITRHLFTKDIPDPELLIRTSGEQRISNFLLWQSAYTEFYFTDLFWPEFDRNELCKAIISYQNRERRFGKTSEQITD